MADDIFRPTSKERILQDLFTTNMPQAIRDIFRKPSGYELWVDWARAAERSGNKVNIPDEFWQKHGEKISGAGYPREIVPNRYQLTPDKELDLVGQAHLNYPETAGNVLSKFGQQDFGRPTYQSPENAFAAGQFADVMGAPPGQRESKLGEIAATGRDISGYAAAAPDAYRNVMSMSLKANPLTKYEEEIYDQHARQRARLDTQTAGARLSLMIQELENAKLEAQKLTNELEGAGIADPKTIVSHLRTMADSIAQRAQNVIQNSPFGNLPEMTKDNLKQETERLWAEEVVPMLTASGVKDDRLEPIKLMWEALVDSSIGFVNPDVLENDWYSSPENVPVEGYELPRNRNRYGAQLPGFFDEDFK